MKVLVLNGLDIENKTSFTLKELITGIISKSGNETEWIDLVEKEIDYCTGCGYCGDKKPGICVKNDDMEDIYLEMVNSELWILLSSISFGGYNSEIKRVIDRYSPMGLITYSVYKGELHHLARYSNPISYLSIGIMNEKNKKEEETFKLVNQRMANAVFAEKTGTVILNNDLNENQLIEKFEKRFKEMELIS